MPTAVIYARVSDEEQLKGKSVDDQINVCKEFAVEQKWDVIKVCTDEGKTATTKKGRDGLLEALVTIQEESVKYLLITETDRFARNTEDHIALKKLLREAGCTLYPITQSFVAVDSPINDAMDTVLAVLNQLQSQLNGTKTSRAMLKKIERGDWPGWAPLGYINRNVGSEDKPKNVVQLDEIKAPQVKDALELFSTGNYTVEQLNAIMFERGLRSKHGKKMPVSTMIDMIRNPFYFGKMEYKNPYDLMRNRQEYEAHLYQGNHESLISKATFDRNVELLGIHGKHADRARKHDERFYLRTYLRCGICGGRVTAELHDKKGMAYYHCSLKVPGKKHSNKGQNIPQKELEELITKLFQKIQLTGPLMDKILARAKEILDETHSVVDGKKRALRNRLIKLEQRRDNLEIDRLDRVIDVESYNRQHERAKVDIAQVQEQMKALEDDRDENIEVFSRLMVLTDDLHKTYKNAKPQLRRHLISLFFSKILIKDRTISDVQYTKAVQVLKENRSIIIKNEWLPLRLSARTLLDACSTVECKIIYVGNFPCWTDEVRRIRRAERGKPIDDVPSPIAK